MLVKLHRLFPTVAEMLTVSTVGPIKHVCPEENVHTSKPATDEAAPNDTYVRPSNYFKHQVNNLESS